LGRDMPVEIENVAVDEFLVARSSNIARFRKPTKEPPAHPWPCSPWNSADSQASSSETPTEQLGTHEGDKVPGCAGLRTFEGLEAHRPAGTGIQTRQ